MKTLKQILSAEARYYANRINHDLARADEFCRTYFGNKRAPELLEAMRKGPEAAQAWVHTNY